MDPDLQNLKPNGLNVQPVVSASEPPRHTGRWIILLALIILIAGGVVLALSLRSPKLQQSQPATKPTVKLKTPRVSAEFIVTGLQKPTAITSSSADSRLYVLEQDGDVRTINQSGQLDANLFLDIKSKVTSSGEMGLLGMAFHPQFKQNGYFYLNYIDKSQTTVIARYHVDARTGLADPASEKVLFRLPQQAFPNHKGGALVFGPDGYLYASLGDGGGAGDPNNQAQNKTLDYGKILRFDVDRGDPFGIPQTNPFVNQAGTKPEIWAYGLRNPWRISFDKTTGDLYIADVGQNKFEELDVQRAHDKGGENYGWRCFEATHSFNADGCKDASKYVSPVLEYDHSQKRCSITGGYVYRGSKYPALNGKYFYGDYCGGQLYYASAKNDKWTSVLAAQTPYAINTFGQGSDGELYFADYKTGSIYHIQDTAN